MSLLPKGQIFWWKLLALPPCPPSIYTWALQCPETCILLCPAVVLDRYCSCLWCGRKLHVPGSPSTGLPLLCRSKWETRDIQTFSLRYTRLSSTSLHRLLGLCSIVSKFKSEKFSLENKLINNLWFWDQNERK